MSINSTFISGNLTRDCKAFKNEDGKSTVYFTVACGYRAKNRETGEWEDRADFVECRAYGRSDAFAAMLTKGTHVSCEGKFVVKRAGKDKGYAITDAFLAVRLIDVVSRAPKSEGETPQPAADADPETSAYLYDEDVPF